jgi:hypothetical protein
MMTKLFAVARLSHGSSVTSPERAGAQTSRLTLRLRGTRRVCHSSAGFSRPVLTSVPDSRPPLSPRLIQGTQLLAHAWARFGTVATTEQSKAAGP